MEDGSHKLRSEMESGKESERLERAWIVRRS